MPKGHNVSANIAKHIKFGYLCSVQHDSTIKRRAFAQQEAIKAQAI